MIDPKAEPIGNRTPYKPVDLRPKWRKPDYPEVITPDDVLDGVIPDEMLYDYWVGDRVWRLKK